MLYGISRGASIRYEEIKGDLRGYLKIRKRFLFFFFFCYSRKFYIVEKLKIEKYYINIYILCIAWYATFNKIAASSAMQRKNKDPIIIDRLDRIER